MKLENRLKRITVNYKTGFRNSTGKRVVILDEQYEPFYDTANVANKVWEFNLPAGVYYIQEGKIVQRATPVEYTLETLPPRQRKLADPETFPVLYKKNDYTASIFWDAERSPYGKRCIVFDPSLQHKTLPEREFIYHHECGHRFWDKGEANENACDMYAKNKMLELGYNPSQIGMAMITTLSDNNMERKEKMIDSLLTA
jgi:hypothetical protein